MHDSSKSTSSDDLSAAARSMATVMPYARDWQEMLWESVVSGKSGHVTLRVKLVRGEVRQVQRVLDAVDHVGEKPCDKLP